MSGNSEKYLKVGQCAKVATHYLFPVKNSNLASLSMLLLWTRLLGPGNGSYCKSTVVILMKSKNIKE